MELHPKWDLKLSLVLEAGFFLKRLFIYLTGIPEVVNVVWKVCCGLGEPSGYKTRHVLTLRSEPGLDQMGFGGCHLQPDSRVRWYLLPKLLCMYVSTRDNCFRQDHCQMGNSIWCTWGTVMPPGSTAAPYSSLFGPPVGASPPPTIYSSNNLRC